MSNKGTRTPAGDESPIDLTSVLAKPVAGAISAPVFSPDTTENVVELDPEPEPEPQQQQQRPGVWDTPPTDYSQEQPYEPQSLSPDDLAIIGVNMLNGLQSTLFAMIKRNKAFEETELEMLNKLDHSGTTVYPTGSKEAIAMSKLARHKEFVKSLPFSPEEKQRLTDATVIYARTTQIKVSPAMGLILAYGEVLGTRAFTVLGGTD
ncbi:hypothetical protein DYU05_04000 [Mucilaginibacter terrenus]|uniref:Uncharacterized protein n=1 Tax=Mucilaginibacter terrenus TaxID=2482727 RepID=A0A3E2NUU5_9SPHI|nr:hypothetical protein [Mucilaginibacter terrenus]RFZ84778.1 hypothetical protein DYU05_04000 [Mucilaginibacter terrenus]